VALIQANNEYAINFAIQWLCDPNVGNGTLVALRKADVISALIDQSFRLMERPQWLTCAEMLFDRIGHFDQSDRQPIQKYIDKAVSRFDPGEIDRGLRGRLTGVTDELDHPQDAA
jgi:hypothetical protein